MTLERRAVSNLRGGPDGSERYRLQLIDGDPAFNKQQQQMPELRMDS